MENNLPQSVDHGNGYGMAELSQDQGKFGSNKKPFINKLNIFLVVVGILLSSFVFYKFLNSDNITNTTLRTEANPTISNKISEIEETVQVKYQKREKYFEDVKVVKEQEWRDEYVYEFYKIGTVLSGKYKGGELLLVKQVNAYSLCKSNTCQKPYFLRFIKKDNTVTFMPKISTHNNGKIISLHEKPFEKYHLQMNTDSDYSIPVLEYPQTITQTARQKIQLPEDNVEEDGELDEKKVYKVFNKSVIGSIYTTKIESSPQTGFLGESEDNTWDFKSTETCKGSTCLETNMFYVFRPDGTFLKYKYVPDFTIQQIDLEKQRSLEDTYLSNTVFGCGRFNIDQISVVDSSKINRSDLETMGKTPLGDSIFVIKDKKHTLYTEFYSNYKKYFAGPYIQEGTEILEYDDFIKSRPLLFWYDPFGRLIRFNNEKFVAPHLCEPIVYLYPESTQNIRITLGSHVHVTDALPKYRGYWEVLAQPSGELTTTDDGYTYPYLFWEGWSYIFPLQKKGFVVQKAEVHSFFERILPKLGLNEKEKQDFMNAWLPQFTDDPYYFITFIDKATIDTLAPIESNPKPETTIRILMDYKPLSKPIEVEELQIPQTPQRKGFTLVEWGGINRQ